MEHHKADVWQVAGHGTAGDDATRFLRELRRLRDTAGLGHAELAARAHYPYDTIKAAEVGPTLPDLPVLSAYVRGCGGIAEEWEERWRRLTSTPSLPVPASRHAGNSAAATAGARIGAATQVVDAPDPSVIIAALNRVAEGMAVGGPDMDAAPLTVPPRPAYPADDAPGVSSPDAVSAADVAVAYVSPGHISLPDVPLPEVSLPDVSMAEVSPGDSSVPGMPPPDVSPGDVPRSDAPLSGAWLADAPPAGAFAAGPADEPVTSPADFSPFTPVTAADAPLGIPADGPPVAPPDALRADSPAAPAEPEAGDGPKGWDPIRISAAWPAIGGDDPRVGRGSGDTAATDAPARRADGPSASAAPSDTNAAPNGGTQPVIRQSAWARGVDAFGEPTSVARPGSRARYLMVAVVLVCVLAVVLAIFA